MATRGCCSSEYWTTATDQQSCVTSCCMTVIGAIGTETPAVLSAGMPSKDPAPQRVAAKAPTDAGTEVPVAVRWVFTSRGLCPRLRQ